MIIAGSMALTGAAFAGSPSSYQVTGPVTAVDDSMITVMKGKEKFEIARDSSTKVNGELKVGDKATPNSPRLFRSYPKRDRSSLEPLRQLRR